MSVSPQVRLAQEWGKGFQTGDLDSRAAFAPGIGAYYLSRVRWPEKTEQRHVHRTTPSDCPPVDRFQGKLSLIELRSPPLTLLQSITYSITKAPGKVIVHVGIPNDEIEIASN